MIICLAAAHTNVPCLTLSSLRFSNVRSSPFHPSFFYISPHDSTFSVVLRCQLSKNPSNVLFDQQSPKHKTDDNQHNYIHFLLLFSSFSLQRDVLWTNIIVSYSDLNILTEEGGDEQIDERKLTVDAIVISFSKAPNTRIYSTYQWFVRRKDDCWVHEVEVFEKPFIISTLCFCLLRRAHRLSTAVIYVRMERTHLFTFLAFNAHIICSLNDA